MGGCLASTDRVLAQFCYCLLKLYTFAYGEAQLCQKRPEMGVNKRGVGWDVVVV